MFSGRTIAALANLLGNFGHTDLNMLATEFEVDKGSGNRRDRALSIIGSISKQSEADNAGPQMIVLAERAIKRYEWQLDDPASDVSALLSSLSLDQYGFEDGRVVSRASSETSEFQSVAHAGGKIELVAEDGRIAYKISTASSGPVAVLQLLVAETGDVIDTAPLSGMSEGEPAPTPRRLYAFLISDKEGLFGRKCPECDSYFRTCHVGRYQHCPYCLHHGHYRDFMTESQRAFIRAFCRAFVDAADAGKAFTIDLDAASEKVSQSGDGWHYTEETQQRRVVCDKCKVIYDILGDYGSCPHCTTRNWRPEFIRRLQEIEDRLTAADRDISDRHERETEWERLLRCVSEFEGLANNVRSILMLYPYTPKRRTDLGSLSFQDVSKASAALRNWFGFDLTSGISVDDQSFLTTMFNRRHVFTHNAGQVDAEYLRNTSDHSVKLNQKIRLRRRELKRLLALLRTLAENLLSGVESIE